MKEVEAGGRSGIYAAMDDDVAHDVIFARVAPTPELI